MQQLVRETRSATSLDALKALGRAIVRAGFLTTLMCVIWTPFPTTPAVLIVDHTPMVQLAEFGGEALLLWLVLLPSFVILLVPINGIRTSRESLGSVFGTFAILGLVWAVGEVRVDQMERRIVTMPRVGVVTLNLALASHSAASNVTNDRDGYQTSAVELSRSALDQGADCNLVVWPEMPITPSRSRFVCQRAPSIAAALDVPLLAQCVVADSENRASARLFRQSSATAPEHIKSSLVPFYETGLLAGVWKRDNGTPGSTFNLGNQLSVIPSLCYETHYHPHLARATQSGGNLIAQMSNFGPFGGDGINEMDLAMSRMVAIEYRTPIARSVNDGSAGWIDSLGRYTRQESSGLQPSAQCHHIPFSTDTAPTVFSFIGPWAGWIPGGLSFLTLLILSGRAGGGRSFSSKG